MNEVAFLLNGVLVRLTVSDPSVTLLNWLRENRGLYGTKEGCNEGDCGACTVIVSDQAGARAINACILFLPQIHGKALRTIEGISGPNGELHPIQSTMIKHHASQCGYCTPGFVMALVAAHLNGFRDHDVQLAGNLCRCTGYAAIIRAAIEAENAPMPDWMASDIKAIGEIVTPDAAFLPTSIDQLANWYLDNPTATLVNGATEVGLSVTKELKPLNKTAFLSSVKDMAHISETADGYEIGAGVTITDFADFVVSLHPHFAKMLLRFGSAQVRNSGTIGGNIANGSPIADTPPALIALGSQLRLRKGKETRDIALEDYYISYGKQDRQDGEFIQSIFIAKQADRLKCYKLSKRFDQDISAVLGCFLIELTDGKVSEVRIAFGGMAGTVKRATSVENALRNQPWNMATVQAAMEKFPNDFTPLSDMRASAEYRMEVCQNMLLRYFHEDQGTEATVLEVAT